jgi:hypothetical protein
MGGESRLALSGNRVEIERIAGAPDRRAPDAGTPAQ